MLINKDWDFETAVREISKVYYPGGMTSGQLRNRQVEAWGQLVGKTRALAEFDEAIKRYGSLTAFGREYRATLPTLRRFREFFESLPDDQVESIVGMKKVFISYSWDNDDHKKWVRDLAARLRGDGVDVTLDQWHLVPGDQLPEFMERAIRESDYVLIVCTHKYKDRSDKRQGGVGYEGDIITAEFMTSRNQRKFIPLLRESSWQDSAPSSMAGKYYIDFSSSPYSEKSYDDLQTTILGTREKAPPIGTVKKSIPNSNVAPKSSQSESIADFKPIQITGIIADQVGVPRNDGTEGSALYKIPFRLSQRPPHEWAETFIHNWNRPSRFSTMHRPGIASVVGDTVILDGTTIEEVKDYHRDTLVLITQETNKVYKELIEQAQKALEQRKEQLKTHRQNVDDASSQIKFDDENANTESEVFLSNNPAPTQNITIQQFIGDQVSFAQQLEFFIKEIGFDNIRTNNFSKSQFEAYCAVWKSLQGLRVIGDDLWEEASEENIVAFAEQLRGTRRIVGEGEIFFDESDHQDLMEILESLGFYHLGKMTLFDIRSQSSLERSLELRPGNPKERFEDRAQRLINENHKYKTQYEKLLEKIRVSFRRRLSNS